MLIECVRVGQVRVKEYIAVCVWRVSVRILVLENGRLKEFDSPSALLSDQTSIFYAMAKDAGLVNGSDAHRARNDDGE